MKRFQDRSKIQGHDRLRDRAAVRGFTLNSSHGPLQDLRVRQAFIMGLNRPELADNLFFGLIKPVYGPLSKTTPSYWAGVEKYYPYDPKAAAALLDTAGWKPGPDGIRGDEGSASASGRALHHAISVIEPDTRRRGAGATEENRLRHRCRGDHARQARRPRDEQPGRSSDIALAVRRPELPGGDVP